MDLGLDVSPENGTPIHYYENGAFQFRSNDGSLVYDPQGNPFSSVTLTDTVSVENTTIVEAVFKKPSSLTNDRLSLSIVSEDVDGSGPVNNLSISIDRTPGEPNYAIVLEVRLAGGATSTVWDSFLTDTQWGDLGNEASLRIEYVDSTWKASLLNAAGSTVAWGSHAFVDVEVSNHFASFGYNSALASAPEPSSIALAAASLGGALLSRLRRRRSRSP